MKVIVDHVTDSKYTNSDVNEASLLPTGLCSCSACARKYAALPVYPFNSLERSKACSTDPYPMLDPPFAHDDQERHPANPYLFCPFHVMAFSFQYTSWRSVEINALSDVPKSTNIYGKLVIVQRSKTLLESRINGLLKVPQVTETVAERPGLVVLLRGPPGTGKTATAGMSA